jgi:hypothetical protein
VTVTLDWADVVPLGKASAVTCPKVDPGAESTEVTGAEMLEVGVEYVKSVGVTVDLPPISNACSVGV